MPTRERSKALDVGVIVALLLSLFGQVYEYGRLTERVDGLASDVALVKTVLLHQYERATK